MSRRPGARSRPASPSRSSGATSSASWSATRGSCRGIPRNGYADNALWQAAFLSADTFARYRVGRRPRHRRAPSAPPGQGLPDEPVDQTRRPCAQAPRGRGVRPCRRQRRPSYRRRRHPPPLPAPAPAVELVSKSVSDTIPDVGPAETARAAGIARIQAIRRTVLPDVVRIAIELDQEIDYRYERIEGPVRVFLDLANTDVASTVAPATPFEDSVVKSVRLGSRPGRSTRVVLDLEGAGRHTVFTLYNPYRIVVDIDRRTGGPAVVAAVTTTSMPPPVLKASAPVTRSVPLVQAPAPKAKPWPRRYPMRPPNACACLPRKRSGLLQKWRQAPARLPRPRRCRDVARPQASRQVRRCLPRRRRRPTSRAVSRCRDSSGWGSAGS